MYKNSALLNRGFSLRQAFTITNLVILTVGVAFSSIILVSVIASKRATVAAQLGMELAISGGRVDAIFDGAREAVRAMSLELPIVLDNPPGPFKDWLKIQAELQLPRNPALFDLYFAFGEKSARKKFKSPGMIVAITRNLDYFATPNFNAPSTFRLITYTDPSYQTDSKEIWYRAAVESPGMVRTPFYYDTTYFRRVMISITQALHDPKTGELIGVAGADLTAGRVGSVLGAIQIGKTGGVLLIDAEGRPIVPFISQDVPMIGFKYDPGFESNPDFKSAYPDTPKLRCEAGVHQIKTSDGRTYIYQSTALREPGFCVVAYQDRSEAYSGLYWTVAIMSGFALVVLFISLLLRHLLASFVIKNIGKILENIDSNREHFSDKNDDGEFQRLEPEGPQEIARIALQLNLLYQRLQLAFREVKAEKDRAELATKTKSRFLSVMSHEIRTPLNAMLGLTDVLLFSPLNDEQVRHVRVLQRSGRSLLRILNDILDFSRLEAGKLSVESHEFSLYDLLHDVEGLMRSDAEMKGLRFTVVPPSLDYRLLGDSIRIRQALLNLVGNAIKFTRSGTVEIRVTALQDNGVKYRRFQFEVSDTGIGISADQQSNLFSEFAQADSSITRRYGGTGLGLAISRYIIELLGGKISVRSEVGMGSLFQFTLPLKVLSQSSAEYRETFGRLGEKNEEVEARATESGTPADARTIVVVDDDDDNHRLITAYLKLIKGVRAVHAYSAKEAMIKIRENPNSLVLMDVQMPDIDGLDATREIRRLEREGIFPRHPIVILSANTFAEDREKSIEAGADEHVSKPIHLDQFTDLIKRWFPTA